MRGYSNFIWMSTHHEASLGSTVRSAQKGSHTLWEAIPTLALAMMGIVAPTQLPTTLESGEVVATSRIQQMMRQLGYDQGAC